MVTLEHMSRVLDNIDDYIRTGKMDVGFFRFIVGEIVELNASIKSLKRKEFLLEQEVTVFGKTRNNQEKKEDGIVLDEKAGKINSLEQRLKRLEQFFVNQNKWVNEIHQHLTKDKTYKSLYYNKDEE